VVLPVQREQRGIRASKLFTFTVLLLAALALMSVFAASPLAAAREETSEEASTTADDTTLYLTVPRLGIFNHTVRNERSEHALDLGAIKLPNIDFSWQEGDTNTYIACHRLGWPGYESYHQCLNLPSMKKGDKVILKDSEVKVYKYRASGAVVASPEQAVKVTKPFKRRQIVSLQTCIEAPGDFTTLGPNWSTRYIVRADRVS
jgi:sortase A